MSLQSRCSRSEQQSRRLATADRLMSSSPAVPTQEPGAAALPMARGRTGRAGVPTVTPTEKKGLPPTVATLPTNSMPGSPGLLSKTCPSPLPLSQQKGALVLHLPWPNPALPILLRSTAPPPGKEPGADQKHDEETEQPSLSCSAEILKEYHRPFTPLSVPGSDSTSHFFSDLCCDQTPQDFHSGKRC